MKLFVAAFVAATFFLGVPAEETASSPIGKVVSMITDLENWITKEGEAAKKENGEFGEFCEDRARDLGFQVKTGESEYEELKASIAQHGARIDALDIKVEELAGSIASNEADLKSATEIRAVEAKHFQAEEKDLMETIEMLQRAGGILERQMQAGGAAMVQLKSANTIAQTLNVLVRASLIDISNATRLTAFVQDSQSEKEAASSEDDDEEPGAPAGAVYNSQSGGILDTIQNLADKADNQLADMREKETASQHNFDKLRQSLLSELANSKQELAESKKSIADSSEKRSKAAGDLWVTGKALSEDEKALARLRYDCKSKTGTYDEEAKSRAEELKALADAKKLIQDSVKGASLTQVNFLQLTSALATSRDLVKFEAVRFVRDLARKQHSHILAQLAAQMANSMHTSDPFEKVKSLITGMIAKLEEEAGAEATKKAWCDKELAETRAKKADKTEESGKLGTKIAQLAADSAKLKEEVATLEADLAALAKAQSEMDKLREHEKAAYLAEKAELEKGIAGMKGAVKILREYYAQDDKAHAASEGAGDGIISLLEVVLADFTKKLTQSADIEERAANEYEKTTKENELEKTSTGQGVKYKTGESVSLDKTASDLSSDRSGVQAELDAIVEYLARIEQHCIAKAETYAARKTRREAELDGLREALQILESDTASLVQSGRSARARHHALLGAVTK